MRRCLPTAMTQRFRAGYEPQFDGRRPAKSTQSTVTDFTTTGCCQISIRLPS